MGKINLNTVDEYLKYEEVNGFAKFEKNKKHKKFDDEERPRKNKKLNNKNKR